MKQLIIDFRTLLAGSLLTFSLVACDSANNYTSDDEVDTSYVGYQTSVPVTPDSTATLADDEPLQDTTFEDTHPNDGKPIDYDNKKPY